MKASIVDEYLKQREENRRIRPPNVFYVGDLTSPCYLDTILKIFLDKPHEIETLRIFEAGNTLQDWWRDVLKSQGHRIIGEEQRVRYKTKKYTIHGRYDLLTQFDYGSYVLREVKTMKTAHWLREAKEEHRQQNQFYLNRAGIDFGSVDCIDKMAFILGDKKIDYCFPTRRNPQVYCDLIDVAETLYPYAETAWDFQEREIDDYTRLVGQLPSPNVCWKCNRKNRDRKTYCSYYEECQKIQKEKEK